MKANMDEPDIDATLPGQGYDDEEDVRMSGDKVRRDEDAPPEPRYSDDYDYDTYSSESTLFGSSNPDSIKERLSLVAGASLMALFAYFHFVIEWKGSAFYYSAAVSFLVAVTTWFYMRGSSTMDPVRANFLAGALAGVSVIVVYQGLSSDVDIMQMIFSGLLAGVTSSSLMKASV